MNKLKIALVVLLLPALLSCSIRDTYFRNFLLKSLNPSFSSPEEVARYFAESLREGHFENTLKTCVMSNDEAIAKQNQKEMLKTWDIISTNFLDPSFLPPEYGPIAAMHDVAGFAYEVRMLVSSFLLPEDFGDLLYKTDIQLFGNERLMDRYLTAMRPANLRNLELVRIDPINAEGQFDADPEPFKDYVERAKRLLGLDEILEYTALYKLGEKYFQGEFQIFRYGGNYLINALTAKQSYNGFKQNPFLSAGAALPISGLWDYLSINRLQR